MEKLPFDTFDQIRRFAAHEPEADDSDFVIATIKADPPLPSVDEISVSEHDSDWSEDSRTGYVENSGDVSDRQRAKLRELKAARRAAEQRGYLSFFFHFHDDEIERFLKHSRYIGENMITPVRVVLGANEPNHTILNLAPSTVGALGGVSLKTIQDVKNRIQLNQGMLKQIQRYIEYHQSSSDDDIDEFGLTFQLIHDVGTKSRKSLLKHANILKLNKDIRRSVRGGQKRRTLKKSRRRSTRKRSRKKRKRSIR
jgi:hypothetical protein